MINYKFGTYLMRFFVYISAVPPVDHRHCSDLVIDRKRNPFNHRDSTGYQSYCQART